MLAQHLRELENDGIIARKIYPEVPPKVEYSLTASGKTLKPIIDGLHEWGLEHLSSNKLLTFDILYPGRIEESIHSPDADFLKRRKLSTENPKEETWPASFILR